MDHIQTQDHQQTQADVRLIWVTPFAENIIAYCARVSNPKNQDNTEIHKLLRYCINHKHWSIFEMASMCVEVTTSRAISAQMLRHRSFHFQEFSQRYAEVQTVLRYPVRLQDTKNRQNSIETVDAELHTWWNTTQDDLYRLVEFKYQQALEKGIAKEVARMVLPLATQTKLYMSGTVRDWIHYLTVRTDAATQKEHRVLAQQIQVYFADSFPHTTKGLGWDESAHT